MRLDRVIELARKAINETDANKRMIAIENLTQMTSEKIPHLIKQLDKGIGVVDDFGLKEFLKVDFISRDSSGKSLYRRQISDINPILYNFVLEEVYQLFATITVNCNGNKDRYGWCASLLYISLRNESRMALEEIQLFSHIENKSIDNSEKKYSDNLLRLFHYDVSLIEGLNGSDDDIASQIKRLAKQKDDMGHNLIENPNNRMQKEFATELKDAGIIRLSVESFRKKL